MVNTKCDTSYYDSRGYQRKIFDGNVLYESKAKAMKGSDWKPQVQRFNMTYLLELSKMQRDLEYMEYEFLPTTTSPCMNEESSGVLQANRFKTES